MVNLQNYNLGKERSTRISLSRNTYSCRNLESAYMSFFVKNQWKNHQIIYDSSYIIHKSSALLLGLLYLTT